MSGCPVFPPGVFRPFPRIFSSRRASPVSPSYYSGRAGPPARANRGARRISCGLFPPFPCRGPSASNFAFQPPDGMRSAPPGGDNRSQMSSSSQELLPLRFEEFPDRKPERIQLYKPGRVCLVIYAVLFERGQVLFIQRIRRAPAGQYNIALIYLESYRTGHVLLRFLDRGHEHVHFGRIPESVVYELRDPGDERVPQMHDFPVHSQRFERPVSGVEYRAARGFVDPAGLHADEPVLDQIDPSHAVCPAYLVERREEIDWAELLSVDLDRDPLFKIYVQINRLVRGPLGRYRQLEHIFRRLRPRVFEYPALVARVKEVPVAAVRLLLSDRDGDSVFLRVFYERASGVQIPFPPRRYDLDRRVEGVKRELKTHLVVPFSRRAV